MSEQLEIQAEWSHIFLHLSILSTPALFETVFSSSILKTVFWLSSPAHLSSETVQKPQHYKG